MQSADEKKDGMIERFPELVGVLAGAALPLRAIVAMRNRDAAYRALPPSLAAARRALEHFGSHAPAGPHLAANSGKSGASRGA